MPAFTHLLCSLGVGIVLLATTSCSGGDVATAGGSSPSARPTEEVRVLDAERGSSDDPAPLAAGAYAIPFIGATDTTPWARVQVPPGWGQDRLLLATGPDLDPHLRRVELLAVDGVAPDPCKGNIEPVPSTVADIVAALTAQRTVPSRDVGPASIGGYSGRLLETRVPQSLDLTYCRDTRALRPFGVGGGHTSVFPGWTYRTWVLDVDGDPLVILAAHGPQTTPTELAQLTALVEGTRFVEPR